MAIIPIVEGSQVEKAPVAAAPMDMSAALAPGSAMVGLGQDIGQASNVFQELSQRLQQATNVANVVDAQVKMKKAESDYQNEMATEPDESQWTPGWKENLSALKESVLGNDQLSPMAKAHLTNQFSQFEQESTSKIQTQQVVRTIQRQTAKITNAADYSWDRGDFEGGAAQIQEGIKAGLFSHTQAVIQLQKGRVQSDMAQVATLKLADPTQAYDALTAKDEDGDFKNYHSLDDAQRGALTVQVEAQVNHDKVQTMQSLFDRQNGGEILAPAELQTLVDQNKLKASSMKAILKQQARAAGPAPTDLAAYSSLLTQAQQYSPDDDKTNTARAQIIDQMAQLPPAYRDEVKASLDAATNKTQQTRQTAQANGYIDDLTNAGFFGVTKKDATGELMEPKQALQAFQTKRQLVQAVNDFLRDNPKASPDDQINFVNQKIRGQTDQNSSMPLFNALSARAVPGGSAAPDTPQTIYSQAQYDALPIGARFTFNGRTGTKQK